VTPAQVKRYFGVIPKDSLPYMSTQVEVSQIVHLFKAGRNRKLLSRTKAQELREQILKGDDFDLMAKLYSQDPGSATQGGKILGIMRGQMVPEFEAAAMSGKKGEISPVIESAYGYHIIELLDKRGNEYDARHILIRPEADIEDQKNSFAFLDSLREAIVKDSITFEKAANKYSDDANTKANGGYITDAGTGSTRIPTEDLDPKLFFTIDTMKVGTVSKPIPFVGEDGKGGFRILYYKSKLVPHEANLKDDYQKIQNSALGDKRTKAMKAWVRKAKNEVAITVDPEYADCKLLDEEAGI
jgi:peptidyl-prolyl cis-trans isomerase SurA